MKKILPSYGLKTKKSMIEILKSKGGLDVKTFLQHTFIKIDTFYAIHIFLNTKEDEIWIFHQLNPLYLILSFGLIGPIAIISNIITKDKNMAKTLVDNYSNKIKLILENSSTT